MPASRPPRRPPPDGTTVASRDGDGFGQLRVNRVLLSAQIVERGPTRYTPAGLPALDLRLAHASQVMQGAQARQVSLEMPAVVIGELVGAIERLAVGTAVDFEGFLAKQRNGRGVVLHITGLAVAAEPTN